VRDPWQDARIESEVKARLVEEKNANLTRLGVVSRRAVVYLSGTVTSTDEKALAERLAAGAPPSHRRHGDFPHRPVQRPARRGASGHRGSAPVMMSDFYQWIRDGVEIWATQSNSTLAFQYDFVINALMGAIFIGPLLGALGSMVVVKRMAFFSQVAYSVNSFGHAFGSRAFETTDESRNNWILAVLAFGKRHLYPGIGRIIRQCVALLK